MQILNHNTRFNRWIAVAEWLARHAGPAGARQRLCAWLWSRVVGWVR